MVFKITTLVAIKDLVNMLMNAPAWLPKRDGKDTQLKLFKHNFFMTFFQLFLKTLVLKIVET